MRGKLDWDASEKKTRRMSAVCGMEMSERGLSYETVRFELKIRQSHLVCWGLWAVWRWWIL